ncbi:signal peptidase I [Vagococcus xieshaowenii]|uniref:signal peptidase I n=1 Tax=Vagococcus xieshaowenii TaxID=2562451 RepID=UPI001432514D|nr:signal peptidase I [Vagococcus xieshaowenii]
MKKKIVLVNIITLIFIIVFNFLFKIHSINGRSMEPTIHNNDIILIKKTKLVPRYSLIGFENKESGSLLLKRVIGMPGDEYIIAHNQIIITNKEEDNYASVSKFELDIKVAKELSYYNKIPENQYFVIGDNRGISNDSRKFGFVNKEDVEGILTYRVYPFNKVGRIN